jgi:hypothetical protein
MKYRKKPVVIEAITFDEFVEYGRQHTTNIVNGMPWSFDYKGYPITHENDECYIILTPEGNYYFNTQDMLIIDAKGEIHPCNIDFFNEMYEPADIEFSPKIEVEMDLRKIEQKLLEAMFQSVALREAIRDSRQ